MAPSTKTSIYSLSRETLSLICWALAEYDWSSRSPHRHLPTLARTCRFLSETALDIIWHTLPSIWPLLLLLPEDLYEVHPVTPTPVVIGLPLMTPRVELAFLREPRRNTDFKRWAAYACRVRNIDFFARGLSQRQDRILAFDVPDMLEAHCPKPALPNLRFLQRDESEFSRRNHELLHTSFHLSLGLKTVSLYLPTDPDPEHLQRVVSDLYRLAPRVEKLELWRDTREVEFYRAEERLLEGIETGRLLSLTSFVAGEGIRIAYDALLGLGSLPHLKKINIKLRTDPSDWTQDGRRAGFFPALTEIELDGQDGNPACCISFLSAITPASLDSVSLELRWPDSNQAEALFMALSNALGGLPRPSSVRTIKIALGALNEGQDRNIYHSPCIQPLLALTGLQSLTVLGGCSIIVNDALLDAMSRAWPAIRTIKFDWPDDYVKTKHLDEFTRNERRYRDVPPAPDAPDRPVATLAGLVPLALRCAHLTELELAVDMRAVPSFEGKRGRPPVFLNPQQECKLEKFRPSGSVYGDSWAVASFLSLVFPHIKRFRHIIPWNWWDETEEFYRELLELRRQERRWAVRKEKRLKEPANL